MMMITFPAALGPFEGPATCLSFGIPSKVPWSGMGATSCSLSADRRRFATEAAEARSGMMSMLGIYEQGKQQGVVWGGLNEQVCV